MPEKDYIEALIDDLAQDLLAFSSAQQRPLHSIFIGGGTPSLLSAHEIKRLLDAVKAQIPFAPNIEITMEANPNTVEADKFVAYRAAGVTRISIGVQSFDDQKLKTLGRIHGAQEAKRAAELAHQAGFNSFNLDLMHGLPEQSLEQALEDLQQAIKLAPPHLSWYQLTIEPNTQYFSKPPTLPDDDALWDIFEKGHQLLTTAGYVQYETSGYSHPDFQCRHNLNYWRFGDYLGIGCGAHGKVTGDDGKIYRTVKIKHPRGYLQANSHYLSDKHTISQDDLAFEYFMNRFRLIESCPKAEFLSRTGLMLDSIKANIEQAISQGYLEENATHWRVTKRGRLFLNDLLATFLDG